ncbi:ubiquinone biosynthesis accessory factor UbiK [Pleionea litopenaei]|uniref:Ubiquinone biosynthesis accessory factor UbiK n=1 Tax=Pleionea litopenaei TaxID=3070815 RepID=A0AA51RRH1_9GAMM|nr:accessory factor UbiK family protein [Pleionea sp. HL-JVS1]WMS86119.1 accessory factor UbiK family protein [Pleionea sp. HL-JVS1]
MIDPKIIDEISGKMSQLMPPELKKFSQQMEQQWRQVLQSQLSKLELVSREEFDVQSKVLLKTRQKLEVLEQQVAELERLLKEQ